MSSDGAGPWWASGDDGGRGPEADEDPIALHREARRGGTGPVGDGPASPQEGRAHDPDVCVACPVCIGLRMLGEVRPDLLVHLTEATRHLTAAARTLFEAVAAEPREDGAPGPSRDDVTRIDLD